MSVWRTLTDPAVLRARLTGRSQWAARYRLGRVIYEWERDWSLIPRRGLIEVRLACPNGQVATLGNTVDASDRLFQFKVGSVAVGLGGSGGRSCQAHVIGLIHGTDGRCTLYAWRYDERRLDGPIEDNANALRYLQVGPLAADPLGITLG